MSKPRKRKNTDLLSPLPTKMSRRETLVKASVKIDQPGPEGTVSMHRHNILMLFPG